MEHFQISKESYRLLLAKLENLKNSVESLKGKSHEPGEGWLDSKDVCEILRISSRQLQNYRDLGVIPFSQFGNKIYYRWVDVEAHLMRHYKKAI
jgi:MerR family transcriptional regulator, repressor of the yfmOP operon